MNLELGITIVSFILFAIIFTAFEAFDRLSGGQIMKLEDTEPELASRLDHWLEQSDSIRAVFKLLLFVLVPSWPVYLAGACLLGFFYGIYYFTFTFHALINPLKSARYAAGNETIVGMTSTFAPILAGLLAMQCGAKFPFWLGVGLAAAAGLFFFWKVRQAQRNSAGK